MSIIQLRHPGLFPLPSPPIERAAYHMWRDMSLSEISAALNVYYLTMPPYEPPPVHNNPAA